MRNVLLVAYDLINNNRPAKDRDVVVFDIDDTLINTLGEPIMDVMEFYKYVKIIGFKTIIITAREGTPLNIKLTIDELKRFGISDYQGIYFRDPTQLNIEQYKINSRKNVLNLGFNTVMSVGDMYWDIGIYGGIGIII
jgi:predicted secreted acid phosphatase